MVNTTTIEDIENAIMAAATENPGKLLAVHMIINDGVISSHMSCDPGDIEFSTQNIMSICVNGTELNINLNECEIRYDTQIHDDLNVEESIELSGDSWIVNIDFLN